MACRQNRRISDKNHSFLTNMVTHEHTAWEIEGLEKIGAHEPQRLVRALHDLWEIHPTLHKNVVVNAYVDGRISLSKAAEELNVTRREFENELRQRGIPIRQLTNEDVVAEVQAITHW